MRRYGLRDDQWKRIKDFLPGREGSVGVTADDNRLFVEAVLYRYRAGARSAGTLRRLEERAPAVQPMGQIWSLAAALSASCGGCRQRICHDRQHHRARPSAQRRREKKAGEDQAIGRSRGGLSSKIRTMVDALGNPVGFFLTGGQAHDLIGADHLLPEMQAGTLIAD